MKFDKRRLATVALAIALLVGGLGLGAAQAQDEGTLININTADEVELMMLKGIGEGKTKAIIEYREAQSFETIEDIMKVSGIGEKTFENIKDRIAVGETADE